jgi:hypothetical protein
MERVIMRTARFPIAGLMGAILVVALGLAALRNGTETWAGATFLVTCAVLCLALVGIVCRGEAKRAWWLGFALFGWGYLALASWCSLELPTMAALDAIAARLGVHIQFNVGTSGGMGGGMMGGGLVGFGSGGSSNRSPQQIGHYLWALLAALIGGVLAHALFGGPGARAHKRDPDEQPASLSARTRSLCPAALGLAGALLMVCLGLIGSGSMSGFWVGAIFLATCGLLGMIVLGCAGAQGRQRQVWLGAALFGIGYMALAYGRSVNQETWPSLPTDHLLYELRRWLPPVATGFPASSNAIAAANARVHNALERPVPMRFPRDTPLEDVLHYVRAATRAADGTGIPIYVDPIGLQEVERSMSSTVQIDVEGVALRTSLRLCLDQLFLTYRIRDGLILITSKESSVTPVYEDPFLIVGHCLLALAAAGVGGIVAPLVLDRRRPSVRNTGCQ